MVLGPRVVIFAAEIETGRFLGLREDSFAGLPSFRLL
jgi:hypothetical protein